MSTILFFIFEDMGRRLASSATSFAKFNIDPSSAAASGGSLRRASMLAKNFCKQHYDTDSTKSTFTC